MSLPDPTSTPAPIRPPASGDDSPTLPAIEGGGIALSVVSPAHNEEENVRRLVDEVESACGSTPGGWEFIIVDDGSTDSTRRIVLDLMHARPWLRCLAMTRTPPGRGNGQSAAFHAGFRAARGRLIAVLDADLQNDPADLPAMIDLLRARRADM
ncbi:MAG TPA: glycosyltransferase family 2 protein, partial [Phycisphaerales bacterium]|nr:glycosyltransferase family 2 protein [Phycisphaerales bacterium]